MSSNKVASILRSQILSQQYQCNDKLPSERKLSSQFKVARGTIREALTQLEQEGIVETRAGSGTYITYNESSTPFTIIQATSPLELIDARFAIEPQIAKLAVLNATSHDIAKLKSSLQQMDGDSADSQRFSEVDEKFHCSLAECTHNSLIIWMHKQIIEIRGHEQWQRMKKLTLKPEAIEAYNQHHIKILQAIEQRDSEQAVKAMRSHLQYARMALTQATNN